MSHLARGLQPLGARRPSEWQYVWRLLIMSEEFIFVGGPKDMPVPGFQKYFLPFLELIKDGKEYSMTELYESLANHFGLSDEEKNELLPSGLQTRHMKRIQLTRTFLKKALLIENNGRAEVRIIERGIKLLAENPKDINSIIFWTVVDGVNLFADLESMKMAHGRV
jgi:hypothetical protein